MTTNVGDKLRPYLIDDLDIEVPPDDLGNEFPLLGQVDSLGLLEMVTFIEDELGVGVSNTELTPKNSDSLGGMVRFVESKLEPSA